MPHIDRRFIQIAILYALAGQALGIYMGIAQAFENRDIHAHINLVGWVSLALAGLVYRCYPRLKERALARWHFWIANAGALLLSVGIYFVVQYEVELPVILGSLLTIAGTALLAVNVFSGMGED
jgi:hypothetical protein